jgi:Uma2 family endonuclease
LGNLANDFTEPPDLLVEVVSFRPSQLPTSLVGADRIDVDDILPGFVLTVQELFDLLQVN